MHGYTLNANNSSTTCIWAHIIQSQLASTSAATRTPTSATELQISHSHASPDPMQSLHWASAEPLQSPHQASAVLPPLGFSRRSCSLNLLLLLGPKCSCSCCSYPCFLIPPTCPCCWWIPHSCLCCRWLPTCWHNQWQCFLCRKA